MGDEDTEEDGLPGVPCLTSSDSSDSDLSNPPLVESLSDDASEHLNNDTTSNHVISHDEMKRGLFVLSKMDMLNSSSNASDEIIIADSQFMLVLATIVKACSEGEDNKSEKYSCPPRINLSFQEFLQCYKIIISGMQMLKGLPDCDDTKQVHLSFRTRAKARTIAILNMFGSKITIDSVSKLEIHSDMSQSKMSLENTSLLDNEKQARDFIFSKNIDPKTVVKNYQSYLSMKNRFSWKLIIIITSSLFLLYFTAVKIVRVKVDIPHLVKEQIYLPSNDINLDRKIDHPAGYLAQIESTQIPGKKCPLFNITQRGRKGNLSKSLNPPHIMKALYTQSQEIIIWKQGDALKYQPSFCELFGETKSPLKIAPVSAKEVISYPVALTKRKSIARKRKVDQKKLLILSNIFSAMSGAAFGMLVAQKAQVTLSAVIHPIAATLIAVGYVTLKHLHFHEYALKKMILFRSRFFDTKTNLM